MTGTKTRLVSDAQLAILTEVAAQFVAPGGYTQTEGASQVGLNKRSLRRLLDDGHLTRTDTGDSDTCGGRYRLHLTDSGRAQLRRAIERRLVPAVMFGRPLLGVSVYDLTDAQLDQIVAARRATPEATRILAIPVDALPERPSAQTREPFVSRVGTVRRIQALIFMGWPHRELSTRSGLRTHPLLSQQGRWVTRTTHDKIAALYDELAMVPGPSLHSRGWARRLGYVGPLAWDDIDHDLAPNTDGTSPEGEAS